MTVERRGTAAINDRDISIHPIRLEWALALTAGDSVFTQRFHIPVETGWSGFDDALPVLVAAARASLPSKWRPALFFEDGVLVGNGGWKGPPVHGVAEIGYAVAPPRQGRGLAIAVVGRLVDQARREGLRAVIAHTLPEENASTRVLARCGFERTAVVSDPDAGPVWRWEVRLAEPAGALI